MVPYDAHKVLNGAPSQNERWPRALDPDYAQIDDRSFASLIDFACRFGSLVKYYGSDNKEAGDWVGLFTHDTVVAMTSMVAADTHGAERELARLARHVRKARDVDRKRAGLFELFDAAVDLPRQIDGWLQGTTAPHAAGNSLQWRTDIEAEIRRSLSGQLRQLKAYELGAVEVLGRPVELEPDSLALKYSAFTPVWRLEDVAPDTSIYAGASSDERIHLALPHLLPVWRPFAAAVARWAVNARGQLANGFEDGGRHQPHIALFVAFVRLLAVAQTSVNSFAGRRTDFYFRRVLREHNRPAVPDTAYVAFTCAAGTEPLNVLIPAGTRLSAGKDAGGREIMYASQEDIRVTSAALARAFTIRVVSGPLPANGTDRVVTQQVLSRTVAVDRPGRDGWATFGSVDDPPAELGFAVGSPALALAGGERTIAIEIRHAPFTQVLADTLAGLSRVTGVAPSSVFGRLLEQAFVLRVSTAEGWRTISEYAVAPLAGPGDSGFTLRFTMAKDSPAVTGGAGAGVASTNPAVRADLRQVRVTIAGPLGEASVYPLSVLTAVTVRSAAVNVDVAGLPGVRVANTEGDVDQTKPFPAFGAVPTVGSYLRIRHAELFSKTVGRLALRIKWFDLPKNRTGFRGYYQRYVIDPSGAERDGLFDNRVFRASVTVEQAGSWTIGAAADEGDHYLFRTIGSPDSMPEADDALAKAASIEDCVILPSPGPPADYKPSEGCLRVELTEPPYAFGHSLYPQNMLHAVLVDLPTEASCDAACRDEYSVLLDTTRRLEAFLGEEISSQPAAAGRRTFSPLSWLARLAKWLRTAYLDLTRSLLAYLTRERDASTRSGWIIRIHDAGNGGQGSTAPLSRSHSYKRAVTLALSQTLSTLLSVADTCLSDCLDEWQDLFPKDEWLLLREQLRKARSAPGSDQLAASRKLLERLIAAGKDAGTDGTTSPLRKGQAVLQAASWVQDCAIGLVDEPEAAYRKAVRANLTKCVGVIHKLYDDVMKSCKVECLTLKRRPLPNPPYLPQIETLTVDYSSSAAAAFSHLLPCDGYRQVPLSEAEPPPLLPQFAHAGNLYLGFSRLTPPQTLHLYARMGQSDPDRSTMPSITWEYLAANRWLRLQAPPPRADATRGLQRSGIISLALPDVEAGLSTILPADCQWLRAAVGDHPDEVPCALGLVPHAVKAVRQLPDTATDDLARPLPAGIIAGFVRPVKGIASVTQPSRSFGGRPPETDRAFQTRLSERLRHKDRAILGWDYERLVLERFPAVWKVRTIPARRRTGEQGSAGPGNVRVVIVPGPNLPEATDPTAPTASGETLAEIEQALRAVAGPFVQLQVLNPLYVRIRVSAIIRWREGDDPRVHGERLNGALIEYLSPWRADTQGDGYCSEAAISEFIHSRDDVQALVSIGFVYDPSDPALSDIERCFLTSAATHEIRSFVGTMVEAVDGY